MTPYDKKQDIYETFVGKPGHYYIGNIYAIGVLKEVNIEEGYLAIQPSLVAYGESGIRIEEDFPTVIGFAVGSPISMRPLKEGDIEKIINERKEIIEANSKNNS
jgi:hypothetical protein